MDAIRLVGSVIGDVFAALRDVKFEGVALLSIFLGFFVLERVLAVWLGAMGVEGEEDD